MQVLIFPTPPWGPIACMNDPKRNIETKKLKAIVLVIIRANF